MGGFTHNRGQDSERSLAKTFATDGERFQANGVLKWKTWMVTCILIGSPRLIAQLANVEWKFIKKKDCFQIKPSLFPLLRAGDFSTAFPKEIKNLLIRDFRKNRQRPRQHQKGDNSDKIRIYGTNWKSYGSAFKTVLNFHVGGRAENIESEYETLWENIQNEFNLIDADEEKISKTTN